MSLTIPLGPDQISAANRIYGQLPHWQLADRALAELADCLPGFRETRCLIKAAAVNALYATHVLALTPVAIHASRVLAKTDLHRAGPELVEELAAVAEADRRFRSFASKFCHFFIDAERFPVLDGYANEITAIHLGKSPATDYVTFAKDFGALRLLSEFRGPNREVDRYLWIAGAYRAYHAGEKINQEAEEFFDKNENVSGDLRVVAANLPPQHRRHKNAQHQNQVVDASLPN